jgi:hypothetical protein
MPCLPSPRPIERPHGSGAEFVQDRTTVAATFAIMSTIVSGTPGTPGTADPAELAADAEWPRLLPRLGGWSIRAARLSGARS